METNKQTDLETGFHIFSLIMETFGKDYKERMEIVEGENWRDIPIVQWKSFDDDYYKMRSKLRKHWNKAKKKK